MVNTGRKKERAPEARVYSYIRFSTPEQKLGDSERRQLELAEEFAAEEGLELDETLRDEGLSGYHGTHRKKGALGGFLQRIKAKEIPKGSVLVVENIDRLGREDVLTALGTVTTIINHGVSIITLSPYRAEYTRETINEGMVYQLVGDIKRANAESEIKSKRVKRTRELEREAARDKGLIMTAQCPAWLRKASDTKFDVEPGAAATIRMIFDWKLQGLGQQKTERRLNAEAPWSPPPKKKEDREAGLPGNGWRTSYIKKILGNRAVIGEFQPHQMVEGKRERCGPPIEDYYPCIVEPTVFYSVQKLLEANRGKGGRTGKKRNIFTHIVKCGYCGSTMQISDKGKKPENRYLVCDNARRGVSCKYHTVRYAEAQELVLDSCRHLEPEQVLPSSDEQTATVNALRQSIKGHEEELRAVEEQIGNYMARIGRTNVPKMQADYEALVVKLHEQAESVSATLGRQRRELSNAESGTQRFRKWRHDIAELMGTIADEEAADIRTKLNLHLREFIDHIEIFPVGFRDVADPNDPTDWDSREMVALKGDVVTRKNGRRRRRRVRVTMLPHLETISVTLETFWAETDLRPTKKQRAAFERHVLKRRMSKEGRFYRIRFKNGERLDVVPPGGLATGLTAMDGNVKETLPDLDALWMDFQRKP
jgi:DNA invertase Pin-like site-specific DNA recombinase